MRIFGFSLKFTMLAGALMLALATPVMAAEIPAPGGGTPTPSGSSPTPSSECSKELFFGIPNWSTGLEFDPSDCTIKDFNLEDIWIVVANITRMVLALAGLAAVAFIIFGGITYITSSGNPDKTKQAQGILTNAVVGLIIAVVASFLVSFVAGLF